MSRKTSGSKNVGIKSQVLVAMGSILFLFALVLGFYFYTAAIMPAASPGSSKLSTSGSQDTYQLADILLEAQNSANLFFLNNDQTQIENHKAISNKLVNKATQFKKAAVKTNNKADVSAADTIITQAQSYNKTFQQLAQTRISREIDSATSLRGQLNSSSQKLDTIVSRNEASGLALAMVAVQVQQKDYFRTKRGTSLRNLALARKNLERVAREAKIDPLDAQLLRKSIKRYSSAFDRYQAVSLATIDSTLSSTLGSEQKRQAEAMQSATEEIESIIARVNVPNAANLAMDIRQHETDYLLYGSEESINRFDQSLDALVKTFNNSSILLEHKSELVKASVAYRDAFKSLVESDKNIKELANQFSKSNLALSSSINAAAGKISGSSKGTSGLPFAERNNVFIFTATIAGLVVILIGLIVALVLGKSISTPIASITKILQRIVMDQDFTVEIPVTSKNEIGSLAVELNNLLRLQQSISHQAYFASTSLSSGMSELIDITKSLSNSIDNVANINSGISLFTTGYENISANAQDSIKEMNEAAENIAQAAKLANDRSELIAGSTDQISQTLDTTLKGIKDITESSSQIAEIITLSTEIAEQTNLLALNASVKAARAGSHGKEFAVIADDIAKLAQRSEEVAKEAKQLTADMSARVNESITLGDDSKKALDQILEAGQANIKTTKEYSDQTDTILTGTGELTKLIEKFSTAIQEIATLAKEQVEEYTTAQETVSNLLAKASELEDSSELNEEEGESATPVKELAGNIAISRDKDEEAESEDHEHDVYASEPTDDVESEYAETEEVESEDDEHDVYTSEPTDDVESEYSENEEKLHSGTDHDDPEDAK